MEHNADFSSAPVQYQYLLCFHALPEGGKTMRNLMDIMGVPRSTAYHNVNRLREKGLLAGRGGAYALTRKGLAAVGMDSDLLANLVFWLTDDLGCDAETVYRVALNLLYRTPIRFVRDLADVRASGAALSRAGAPARGLLAAPAPGRHDADFSVCGADGGTDEEGEIAADPQRPAVFIAGRNGDCCLELYAPHLRRIAAAMPGGKRTMPKRLLYELAGGMTECCAFLERWHIRGDAVTGFALPDGKLAGRVRVAAENARGECCEAEITLRFGFDAADGEG
jgi:hypothetical protein